MRLQDLAPHWVDDPGRQGTAFAFTCPCLKHRVYVSLAKPLDGGISIPETLGEKPYHHTGRTFEDLTIFPPVRFGHFVGIIRGGEVTFGDLALNRLAAQD